MLTTKKNSGTNFAVISVILVIQFLRPQNPFAKE